VQIHHISLGLVYLHSRKIVHGDLKAVNVLIDDGGKAVLCDFGLTRIKADATTRTTRTDSGSIVGSRNWMAPELLLGGSLKKPCDIYAFGMTLFENAMSDRNDQIMRMLLNYQMLFGKWRRNVG